MKEFRIKLEDFDGDIYKYGDVSKIEIYENKLNIKYGEDENAIHLMNHVEEILIQRNR